MVCERFKEAIANYAFECESGSFDVTLSVGVTLYDAARSPSPEWMIAEADKALYQAKAEKKTGS